MLKVGMKVVRKTEGVNEGSKDWWHRQKVQRGYIDKSVFTVLGFRYGEEILLIDDVGRSLTAAKQNWLPAEPTTSIEDWM